MENEEKITEQAEKNYIDTIAELKRNSIDRSEYEKLLEENKQLLKNFTEFKPQEEEVQPQKNYDLDGLRKKLFGDKDLSNLEYIQTALELREGIIEKDGPEADPFVGKGHDLVPTEQDYTTAQKVANVFQHCVDVANGDSEVFTNELQRLTNDISLPRRKK